MVITLDDRIGLARKSSIVVEEVEPCQTPVSSLPKHVNTMEDDLRTKAVYSPHFLEELRNKYDRRRRETDRKVEEQTIKKKFYEDKNEETLKEMEERISNHMTITQVDVREVESDEEEESEEEEEIIEMPEITDGPLLPQIL